jgi:hypothetical protein
MLRISAQQGNAQGLCNKPRQTGHSGNDVGQALLTYS